MSGRFAFLLSFGKTCMASSCPITTSKGTNLVEPKTNSSKSTHVRFCRGAFLERHNTSTRVDQFLNSVVVNLSCDKRKRFNNAFSICM